MISVKKFLFDKNNFDKKDEPVKPTFNEEQLTLAQAQSHALGRAEGLAEAKQKQEEFIAQILQKTFSHVEKLVTREEQREVDGHIAATRVAMKVIHKLLPSFAEKYALPEIERVILDAVETRRDEPRIAVIVPTAHLDALKERIDAVAMEKGYAGRVIVIADDAMGPADCRVEWADGGAERIYARLFAQIENEFTRAIAGMMTARGDGDDDTDNNRHEQL